MNRLSDKLKLLFIPFLIIAVFTIAGYTFLNWLFIVKLHLFASVKENIIDFGIPFVLPWIPILSWLRPRLKRLNLKTKTGDLPMLYMVIAWLAIAIPTTVAQRWVKSASGTLSNLDNIKQIEEQNTSKYYTLKNYYIDKRHIGIHPSFDVSGKNNQDFNMHIYVSLPVLENMEDTLNSVCFAWIGKEYFHSVSNSLSEAEKEKEYRSFGEKSEKEFESTDFSQFFYLNRIGSSNELDGFKEAIKKDLKYNSIHSDVFEAVNEPFVNHSGNTFAWIFGSLGIGAIVWFLFLLFPKLKEESSETIAAEATKGEEGESGWKDMLSIFIPKEGFYITPILIDLNILIFILMVFSGLGFMDFSSDDLLNWGANFRPSTTNGQWWRLLTSIFLHGGVIHLFANMYGLLFVGIFLEPKFGKAKYAIIYLTTGIIGSLASLYLHERTVCVGASGAIFGLYGVFLALLLTKVFPKDFSKSFLSSTLIFIGYNLLMGFSNAGIDNAAHIGGLVSGFIIGFILSFNMKKNAEEIPVPETVDQILNESKSNEN